MSKRKTLTRLEKEARDLSLTHTKRELATMAARYEFVRKLTPVAFQIIWRNSTFSLVKHSLPFDDLVDDAINAEVER